MPSDDCENLKKKIEATREVLSKKDDEATTADTIRAATNDLQQASLKLFEMAYKKVLNYIMNIQFLLIHFFSFLFITKTKMAADRESASSSSSSDQQQEEKKEDKN